MRLLLFMLGIGVGVLCIEKPAEAQNYPWCDLQRRGCQRRHELRLHKL